MDIIKAAMDWMHFKTMVTPLILKVVYQICFVLLNLFGIIGILVYGVTGLLGIIALLSKDTVAAVIGGVVLAVVIVMLAVFLVF
ncbi:hypothetical protein HY992_02045 [Candidatus Micrarchaeota archaeon]|nr:hypothetical protein [Candidatus Micrarchaeota archaeon]